MAPRDENLKVNDGSEKNFFSTGNESQTEARDKIYGGDNHQPLDGHNAQLLKDSDIDPQTGKKKDKTLEEFLIKDAMNDAFKDAMDNFFEGLDGKLSEYAESLDRQKRMQKALDNGDWDTLRHIYINEYHMDPDLVNDMSKGDLVAKHQVLDEVEQDVQATLKAEIIAEVGEFSDEYLQTPEGRAEFDQRMEELKAQYPEISEQEFQKIFADARKEDVENSSKYEAGVSVSIEGSMKEAFALAAEGNETKPSNPFGADLSNEDTPSNPFDTQSEGVAVSTPMPSNPFG